MSKVCMACREALDDGWCRNRRCYLARWILATFGDAGEGKGNHEV